MRRKELPTLGLYQWLHSVALRINLFKMWLDARQRKWSLHQSQIAPTHRMRELLTHTQSSTLVVTSSSWKKDRWYSVNRLEAEPGSKIQLGRVLALKSAGEFKVGKPYLEGITVEAEIMEEMKGPKVTVYKMKPKKHYRRTNGHRQPLTKFLVTKIGQ
eukprot:jgi/Picre1/32452/NNA_007798.t1